LNKPTKKQLAARRKFAQMAKSGKLAKLRKKKSKPKRSIAKTEKNRLKRARNRGMSTKDRTIMDSLLLAIKDPKVKEIVIRK